MGKLDHFTTKRLLRQALLISLWLILSYELGIVVFRYIDAHAQGCPLWIYRIVRFALDAFGYSDEKDPDTIGAFCGLFALVLSWIFSALALWLAYRLITRIVRSRRQ
ncbi:hypothetical protein [Caballeronia sp. LZ034LL]|uniref:hypothetical protein n=1 Tax=Caballeronia sp. LZ034LL TaxID=3038567 RepID=UPI0028621E29|nr:hypothetical protein [Caballeronia sp. LZ034LL]MDR5838056.1 hypothetical protein [Caballeronia sp. LZ034LL]